MAEPSEKKRVVVWGTGVVGSMVIAEIAAGHPVFELVGVGVSNPAKVGKDVAEVCGLPADDGPRASGAPTRSRSWSRSPPTRWCTTARRRSTPTTTSA